MKLCVRVSKGDDDAMASGLALGGFGVSYLSGRDRRQYVWAPSLALAVTTPLLLLGITRSTINDAIWLILAGHFTLFVYFTPTLALAQNMVGASMRASCGPSACFRSSIIWAAGHFLMAARQLERDLDQHHEVASPPGLAEAP